MTTQTTSNSARYEICRTCRWWDAYDISTGECHRYPPAFAHPDPLGVFPVTQGAWRCGEWLGQPRGAEAS